MNCSTNTPQEPAPSPALMFETINSYQKTAAIKAAIELNLFSAIGDKPASAAELANRCSAAERGIRILCDYLVIVGLLKKAGDRYELTSDAAMFLVRSSPAYAGGTLDFLLSDQLTGSFRDLASAVRKGGTAMEDGTVAPEHPVWLSFARSMGPLMVPTAQALAQIVPLRQGKGKVLDVSASHGMWGLAFAQAYADAHITALDWENVLQVARENAKRFGVDNRFATISGSAFEADLGKDYDVILVPNFLHHFSAQDCVKFLKRAHAALKPDGKIAIVEFVPNADRISPPAASGFALVMLATTPEGDAFTLEEYGAMLKEAGFQPPTAQTLPASMSTAIISAA
jgi:ubiquinone/menaquinone biosynthesis C-methylase UbiE